MLIDIFKRIFTARFFALLAALIIPLLILLKVDQGIVTQIAVLIESIGALIVYIFSEIKVEKLRLNAEIERLKIESSKK